MVGSVGGNPFATQTQAYNVLKPGVTEEKNPNDKLKPASENKETSPATPATSASEASSSLKADAPDRAYDSGGINASRGDQRGMLLDVSA